MRGEQRYDVKAAAGWSRTRRDGSSYQREIDRIADEAEDWFADTFVGIRDDRVLLSGDAGYDVALWHKGHPVMVDVIHAGLLKDGTPRRARGSWVIVNPGHPKLTASDILAYVEGPPFSLYGAVPTRWFVANAQRKDFGFGVKLALEARQVWRLLEALDAVVLDFSERQA